jgi:hypothetical protein
MKIRINNIECREPRSDSGNYEMVKWYPNEYYGSEQKMIDDGYEKVIYPNGGWGMKKDWHTVNESCFQNPESCYVIAWLKINHREPCIDLETVGSRLLNLTVEDRNDFFEVYRIAEEKLTNTFDGDDI